MSYRILVLIIATICIIVTLCLIVNDGRKTSTEYKESNEPEATELRESTDESEAVRETLCEPVEVSTKPELTEAVTVPEETVEVTEAPTEPSAPSEEVATRLYYDVPLDHNLQDHIFGLCEMYNIDPAIIIAMIHRESTYNANCVGDNGNSFGLMQIQKRYHEDRMKKLDCDDLLNPYQNVWVGIDYLAEMLDWGDGNIEWALMAYNGGPTYANEMTKEGKVSKYAKTVLEYADELKHA